MPGDASLQRLLHGLEAVALILEGSLLVARVGDVRGQGVAVAAQEEGLHHGLHHGDADGALVELLGLAEDAREVALAGHKLVGDVLHHGDHVEDDEEQRLGAPQDEYK